MQDSCNFTHTVPEEYPTSQARDVPMMTERQTQIVEPEDLSKVYMPDISPALMVDG